MKSDLVDQASKVIPHPPLLINAVSKRVRQLNMGRSPLAERRSGMGLADVALQEIIDGKIALVESGEVEEVES